MTGDEFKIKMIQIGIKQQALAKKLGISLKTMNSVCNKPTVPLLYQWALYGVELADNREGDKV